MFVLLGEDKIRSVLLEATKSEDLLKKAILPVRKFDRKSNKVGNSPASSSGQVPKAKYDGQVGSGVAKNPSKYKKKKRAVEEEEEAETAPPQRKKYKGNKKKFKKKGEFFAS